MNNNIKNEEEIDLKEYFKIISKYKIFIVLCIILPMILTYIILSVLPKVYIGTVSLSVVETAVVSDSGGIQKLGIAAGFYESLLKDTAFRKEIIKESGLDKNTFNHGTLEVHRKVSPEVLKIIYEHPDRKIVGKILQCVVDSIIGLNIKLKTNQRTGSQNQFASRRKMLDKELTAAEQELAEYRKKANIETLSLIVDGKRNLRSEYETEYTRVVNNIVITKESLKEIKKQFKDEQKIESFSRNIAEDPEYQQTAAKISKKELVELLSLKIDSEYPNPIYQDLKRKLINSTIKLTELNARKGVLKKEMKELDHQLNKLQTELIEKQKEMDKLERKYELTKEGYAESVRKGFIVSAYAPLSIGNVNVLIPIDVTDKPVSAVSYKKILLSGTVSFFLSIFLVVFYDRFLLS